MKRLLLFAWLLTMVAGALPVAAQTVNARLLADSVSIGMRYQLILSLRHDGTRRAVFPDEIPDPDRPRDLVGQMGDFELLARLGSGSQSTNTGGRIDSVVYEVAVFAVDTVRATPTVGLATEQDTLWSTGIPFWIPVRSFVPDDAEDVLDLAPLAEFPQPWWPWVLGALLLAVAGYLLYRHHNRPIVLAADPEPAEPVESPFDEAFRRLGGLTDPVQPEAIKPYYVELSDIVRTYVGRALAVPALETTTRELLLALRSGRRLDESELRILKQLLQHADLVKFADFEPPVEQRGTDRDEARRFIERAEQRLAPKLDEEVPQ